MDSRQKWLWGAVGLTGLGLLGYYYFYYQHQHQHQDEQQQEELYSSSSSSSGNSKSKSSSRSKGRSRQSPSLSETPSEAEEKQQWRPAQKGVSRPNLPSVKSSASPSSSLSSSSSSSSSPSTPTSNRRLPPFQSSSSSSSNSSSAGPANTNDNTSTGSNNPVSVHTARAKDCQSRRDYEGAAKAWGEAISLEPNDWKYLTNRSNIYFLLQKFAMAKNDAQLSIQLSGRTNTPNPTALYAFGRACDKLGEFEAALTALNECVVAQAPDALLKQVHILKTQIQAKIDKNTPATAHSQSQQPVQPQSQPPRDQSQAFSNESTVAPAAASLLVEEHDGVSTASATAGAPLAATAASATNTVPAPTATVWTPHSKPSISFAEVVAKAASHDSDYQVHPTSIAATAATPAEARAHADGQGHGHGRGHGHDDADGTDRLDSSMLSAPSQMTVEATSGVETKRVPSQAPARESELLATVDAEAAADAAFAGKKFQMKSVNDAEKAAFLLAETQRQEERRTGEPARPVTAGAKSTAGPANTAANLEPHPTPIPITIPTGNETEPRTSDIAGNSMNNINTSHNNNNVAGAASDNAVNAVNSGAAPFPIASTADDDFPALPSSAPPSLPSTPPFPAQKVSGNFQPALISNATPVISMSTSSSSSSITSTSGWASLAKTLAAASNAGPSQPRSLPLASHSNSQSQPHSQSHKDTISLTLNPTQSQSQPHSASIPANSTPISSLSPTTAPVVDHHHQQQHQHQHKPISLSLTGSDGVDAGPGAAAVGVGVGVGVGSVPASGFVSSSLTMSGPASDNSADSDRDSDSSSHKASRPLVSVLDTNSHPDKNLEPSTVARNGRQQSQLPSSLAAGSNDRNRETHEKFANEKALKDRADTQEEKAEQGKKDNENENENENDAEVSVSGSRDSSSSSGDDQSSLIPMSLSPRPTPRANTSVSASNSNGTSNNNPSTSIRPTESVSRSGLHTSNSSKKPVSASPSDSAIPISRAERHKPRSATNTTNTNSSPAQPSSHSRISSEDFPSLTSNSNSNSNNNNNNNNNNNSKSGGASSPLFNSSFSSTTNSVTPPFFSSIPSPSRPAHSMASTGTGNPTSAANTAGKKWAAVVSSASGSASTSPQSNQRRPT